MIKINVRIETEGPRHHDCDGDNQNWIGNDSGGDILEGEDRSGPGADDGDVWDGSND